MRVVFAVKGLHRGDLVEVAVVCERCQLPWLMVGSVVFICIFFVKSGGGDYANIRFADVMCVLGSVYVVCNLFSLCVVFHVLVYYLFCNGFC